MQLLTGRRHDVIHNLDGEGAYEWLYVDALSDDAEWGVVMILFRGMPMSPSYLERPTDMSAGCALSVYHRGTRVAFAFTGYPLANAVFSEEHPHVSMGSAGCRTLDDGRWQCSIQTLPTRIGRTANVQITLDAQWAAPSNEPYQRSNAWVLAAPRSKAQVTILLGEGGQPKVEKEFEALAYHDHNMGPQAMQRHFHHWYWGRVQTSEKTLIYLATPGASEEFSWFGEADDRGQVVAWTNVTFAYKQPRLSFMGLWCNRTVVISGTNAQGQQDVVECHNKRVCENGPFYQRYISQWKSNGKFIGSGMSEYMNVCRLRSAWIRPFLRLPWTMFSMSYKR